jgi:hypothetical protein
VFLNEERDEAIDIVERKRGREVLDFFENVFAPAHARVSACYDLKLLLAKSRFAGMRGWVFPTLPRNQRDLLDHTCGRY